MDVREKIAELLGRVQQMGVIYRENQMDERYPTIEQIRNTEVASYLIAHGVTVQEDCKDCAEATQNCIVKLQEQIAELRSAQEWVSVNDRLPTREDANETESILAINKDERYVGRWVWDIVARWPTEFTYWMPIPQPPKG